MTRTMKRRHVKKTINATPGSSAPTKSTLSKYLYGQLYKLKKFDPIEYLERISARHGIPIYSDLTTDNNIPTEALMARFKNRIPAKPGPLSDAEHRAFLNGDPDDAKRPPIRAANFKELDRCLQEIRDVVVLISKKKRGRFQNPEKNLLRLELLFNEVQEIALGLDAKVIAKGHGLRR